MTRFTTRGISWLALLLWLSVPCTNTLAQAPSYRQNIVGSSEEPYLQLSNDSPSPIAAYVMVQRPSKGLEGRSYYDEFVSPRDVPIAHGESKTIRLGHFAGSDLNTLQATVNAVVFENGSSAGDATWVNVILVRRVRLHDSLLSLRALLEPEVGKGLSRDELIGKLHALREGVDHQTLADDLKVVDNTVIDGAILTFSAPQDFSVDAKIKDYNNYLSMRILHLEGSLPKLDSLKGIPQVVPTPLAQSADVLGSRLSNMSHAVPLASAVSYCQVSSAAAPLVSSDSCDDPDGDEIPTTNTYTVAMHFTSYNATTKKTATSTFAPDFDYTAYGLCLVFRDCDNDLDIDYVEGTNHPEGAASALNTRTVTQSGSPLLFYWLFDDYETPAKVLCTRCDPNPFGYTYAYPPTDSPSYSSMWYFNYLCTVT